MTGIEAATRRRALGVAAGDTRSVRLSVLEPLPSLLLFRGVGSGRTSERCNSPPSSDVPPSNGLAILLRRPPPDKRVALRLGLRRQ